MAWLIILLLGLTMGVLGVLWWFRRREKGFLVTPVRDALSESLRADLERERAANRTRKEQFESALRQAGEASIAKNLRSS